MWLVTVAAIVGTIANVKRLRWCFAVWIFTNGSFALYDVYKTAYPQAALQAIYLCLSVWGLYTWGTAKPATEGTEGTEGNSNG